MHSHEELFLCSLECYFGIHFPFPLLLHNLGNKHQNNPLVSAETVCHSSTYIIFYFFMGENSYYKSSL